MREIVVTFLGPKGSYYEDKIFVMDISLGDEYPMTPPKVKFRNKIKHSNIESDGSPWLDILYNKWSPALTVEAVIYLCFDLLSNPNNDDSVDANIYYMSKDSKMLQLIMYNNVNKNSIGL